MGYTTANGRYANTADVILQASAAKTATYQGAWVEIGDRGTLRLKCDVTAISGTPTLDITVETADDAAGTNTRTLSTFTQKTGVSAEKKSFTGCDRFARVNCTIGGGTPSLTFSVAGEAV